MFFDQKISSFFPEIGCVKNILSLIRAHSQMCIRIYIPNLKTHTHTHNTYTHTHTHKHTKQNKKLKRQKAKETK